MSEIIDGVEQIFDVVKEHRLSGREFRKCWEKD